MGSEMCIRDSYIISGFNPTMALCLALSVTMPWARIRRVVHAIKLQLTGPVGRTHIIVRLQTRTRRKDGTENFGCFVYVLDRFLQRDFLVWVFMCSISFILFFWVSTTARATTLHRSYFRLPRRGPPRPYRYIRANRLPRLQGYHTRATTLHINFSVQAGHHTCG